MGSFPTIHSHDLLIFWCRIGILERPLPWTGTDLRFLTAKSFNFCWSGSNVGAVLEETESRKHQANDEKCFALGWAASSTPVGLGAEKLRIFWHKSQLYRLAIHGSLPKSQTSFDFFSNLSICLIRANYKFLLVKRSALNRNYALPLYWICAACDGITWWYIYWRMGGKF